ncbi:MAG: hypothetical protein AUJ49_13555 [Desulfovibrionaceae bacterium CG1_02_65_16]|nr:MAG: hypothetical protein AUJ49_13555 [Desulfovibrionaceae bacterium CG1_02_65_16]
MPTPKAGEPEATRKAIASAAEDLFRTIGYSKTTIADIAANVGMSPSNIYRFFRSKQKIAGAICARIIAAVVERCRVELGAPVSAKDKLAAVLLAYHGAARREVLANQGIYDLFADGLEHLWPEFRRLHQMMTELVGQVVQEGVRRGEFRSHDSKMTASLILRATVAYVDPRHIARLLNDAVVLGEQEHMAADLLAIIGVISRGIA